MTEPPQGQPQPHPHAGPPHGQPAPGHGPQPYPQPAPQPHGYPYPQPGYGAPSAAPPGRPQKSYVGVIAAVTAGIVALIALTVVLVLAMGTTVLDRAAAEEDVAAQFEEREGVGVELDCPQEMVLDAGRVYPCTGTTTAGEEIILEIRIAEPDDEVDYYWVEP